MDLLLLMSPVASMQSPMKLSSSATSQNQLRNCWNDRTKRACLTFGRLDAPALGIDPSERDLDRIVERELPRAESRSIDTVDFFDRLGKALLKQEDDGANTRISPRALKIFASEREVRTHEGSEVERPEVARARHAPDRFEARLEHAALRVAVRDLQK